MPDVTPLNSSETTTKFEFTIVGRINHDVSGVAYISWGQGMQLRVIPAAKEYPDKPLLWHLVPTIDSTAIISNVRVLSSSPPELAQHEGGECVLVGTVVQVSKRQQVVLLLVQSSGKQLKITLTNPDQRMQAQQVWSVKAVLVADKLQIVSAQELSLVEEPEETASPKLVIAAPSPPTQKAIEALVEETGIDGWKLMTATRRKYGWEWEAVAPQVGRKARVAINDGQCQVYQYNSNAALTPNQADNKERLVVTPLGAARGIGASCFQVALRRCPASNIH